MDEALSTADGVVLFGPLGLLLVNRTFWAICRAREHRFLRFVGSASSGCTLCEHRLGGRFEIHFGPNHLQQAVGAQTRIE